MKKTALHSITIPVYIVVLGLLLLSAAIGNQAVTVISENKPIEQRKTVVIDAGHGGVDGGTTSCTGMRESHINLEIALKLNDLMHLLGINTQMIRSTDCSVYTQGNSIASQKVSDLKERVRIVNATENSFLLSIHQNYFTDSRYWGAQVFYSNTPGSKELAGELQNQIVNSLNKGSRRATKEANGIYLMEHIDRCGVLIECGFLSNPQEEALLLDETYQKKLCCVITSVYSRYLYADLSAA